MKEFIKEIPAFGSILLSFENNTSVRVYQNGIMVASNDSIEKIIHTVKKLEEYQAN